MVTRATQQRRAYVMSLVSVVNTLGETIATRAAEAYGLSTATEPAPLIALMRVQTEAAVEAMRALERAEAALLSERSDDDAKRTDRDQASDALVQALRYVRERLRADADAPTVKRLGFTQRPPSQLATINLAAYTRNALTALAANPQQLAPSLGAGYSTEDILAKLAPLSDAFDAAIAALDDDTRETQQARVARDAAQQRFERIAYGAASILEGLCRQANMRAAMERVRPSVRRVSGRLNEDPLPKPDAPTTPDAPAPNTA